MGIKAMTLHRTIQGDVRNGMKLIPDESVHLTITSPPYPQQRDYDGEENQIGMEETIEDYVSTIVSLSKEIWRVTRPDGVYFLNIGEKYTDSGMGPTGENSIGNQGKRQGFTNKKMKTPDGMKSKDLIGVPWMLATALRADGWYWRTWFPWLKRSCMPESSDDRPGSGLEIIHMFSKSGSAKYWTHPKFSAVRVQPEPDYLWRNRDTDQIVKDEPADWKTLLSKSDPEKRLWARTNLWAGHDYFWDPEAIRVPQSGTAHDRGNNTRKKYGAEGSGIRANQSFLQSIPDTEVPGGRNRRNTDWFFDSWADYLAREIVGEYQGLILGEDGMPLAMVVNPERFEEDHFAVYPQNLVRPLILGGTSGKGCCPKCGAPYIRIVEKGDPDRDWQIRSGSNAEGGYNGVSWKYEKLVHGKSGHFHEKEKAQKQDRVGKRTYEGFNARCQQNASDVKRRVLEGMKERDYHWVPSCDCNAGDPVPCIVLDPFLGRGTTARVARDLGRSSVGCELSQKYIAVMKGWMNVHQQELDTGLPEITYIFDEAPE
jgi:DNA modification methylase